MSAQPLPSDIRKFIEEISADPRWPMLLAAFERPKIPTFRKGDAEGVETARARWIYESGRLHQWEAFMSVLKPKED